MTIQGYAMPETCSRRWFILTVTPQCELAVSRRLKRLFNERRSARGRSDKSELVMLAHEAIGAFTSPPAREAVAIEPQDEASDDVATFYAIARWTVRRQGKSVPMERIVFPRYLFVGFACDVPWFDVLELVGVQGVIASDGTPFEIPATTVGEIASKCFFGYYRPAVEPMIQREMRVVARSGRFRGLQGSVEGFADKSRERASVFMEMLGTAVQVPVDDLVSVSYSQTRMSG